MSESALSALPPGPPLPQSVQAALMLRYWPRFVSACRRRYGSVFTVRIASLGTIVYFDDPADIKAVFAGDPTIYHAGEANSILAGVVGESSVLVIDDDLHRDRRRLMIAPFQRDAVARQADVMAEIAAANIARWPVAAEFPVAPRMSEITLEVILRTVVGATDPARLALLREVMPRLLNLGPWASLSVVNPGLQRRHLGDSCVAASKKPTGCCMPRSTTVVLTPTSRSAPTCSRCSFVPATTTPATTTAER